MLLLRMSEARSFGAYTYDDQHGFLVSGGPDNENGSDTVEASLDGVSFNSLGRLPISVTGHCLTSLSNGGDLFLAGGFDRETHFREY